MKLSEAATHDRRGRDVPRRNGWPISALTLAGAALLLFGCGGASETTLPAGGAITGRVTKGPVGAAAVVAFSISGGAMGPQLGAATSDAQGNFTLPVGGYAGPVMLRMSGGAYTDEATGTSMTMQSGDVMTAVVPSVTAGATTSGIQITPLTSMAQARAQDMAGGMTPANIATANGAVGSYFSVGDILHTVPMNPLAPGSGAGATQDAKNYGMCIAAMSEYAKGLGMTTSSSGIVTAARTSASVLLKRAACRT
jgi:hypothetical protein